MRENCSQISSHYFFYQGQDEYFTSEKMLRKMQIQDIKPHTKHL